MPGNYWLVKQEPTDFSWDTLVRERGTDWTGVRNYAARLHLRAMAKGDRVLFYHSGDAKAVVGVAEVTRTAFPDPTATEGDWSAVGLRPVKPLATPVTLAQIKADEALVTLPFVRQSRLSVSPVSAAQYRRVLELGGAPAE